MMAGHAIKKSTRRRTTTAPLHNDVSKATIADRANKKRRNSSQRKHGPSPYNNDPNLPLYRHTQVPDHLVDNRNIFTGYRMNYTTRMCISSMFALHNETFNIWTHLVGFFIFIVVIFIFFYMVFFPALFTQIADSDEDGNATTLQSGTSEFITERWLLSFLFGSYSLSCLACMLFSFTFHTIMPHHNHRIYSWAHAMDYMGITCLIVGSFLPMCFLCFGCHPHLRWVYLTMISVFGIGGIVGPFFRYWVHPNFARKKIIFYVCMVSSGLIPIAHMHILLPGHVSAPYVDRLMTMMLLYGVGVVVYAFQLPESLCPGRFDIYFSSHQIWHVFVLAAALVHFFNCTSMFINLRAMPTIC
ncbi:adiponectin receptor protein 1 [Trypanosoma vivax]|uniref:Adiponectin receptor protein 1 n=1 Tax=Trypanosoma vivax (strain Y486) TaxID=1055687 RepID=G0U7L7_TRYVY|nr:adiponectin receptor protein 1 [Trypanosoma vivax]CCC51875.1 adiponectin receptor protein 1 [Trypanosoma vivax Y486]